MPKGGIALFLRRCEESGLRSFSRRARHDRFLLVATLATGGLLGGIIETVSGAFVKDVTYSIITDLQISERNGGGWKRYQTRVLSTANKVNLEFTEAQPNLEKGLIASISGLF